MIRIQKLLVAGETVLRFVENVALLVGCGLPAGRCPFQELEKSLDLSVGEARKARHPALPLLDGRDDLRIGETFVDFDQGRKCWR